MSRAKKRPRRRRRPERRKTPNPYGPECLLCLARSAETAEMAGYIVAAGIMGLSVQHMLTACCAHHLKLLDRGRSADTEVLQLDSGGCIVCSAAVAGDRPAADQLGAMAAKAAAVIAGELGAESVLDNLCSMHGTLADTLDFDLVKIREGGSGEAN